MQRGLCKSLRQNLFAYFSPVMTVKSVSVAVVVEAVDAGCAMTIVVRGRPRSLPGAGIQVLS